ncbi:Uncharacterized protein YR821_2237 [Yersinia ruckeri]|uniref:Uncharacterized protein n=1 Tax=Yersinia ruckeri TaxID=29486 RepID=A0A0A8VJ84_YERRU|nr:Uncharacterized protein YR821_2237 [Yersinia ruckeri]CEK28039.1 hypothetical protein CSF007_11480 [Yersinia ruckeri]
MDVSSNGKNGLRETQASDENAADNHLLTMVIVQFHTIQPIKR